MLNILDDARPAHVAPTHSAALALLISAACLVGPVHGADLQVLGARGEADVAMPEFLHLWSEGWGLKGPWGETAQYARADMPLGAYIQVYVRNTSSRDVQLEDVLLDGISMSEAIVFAPEKVANHTPASTRFADLPEAVGEALTDLGDPVWWKIDPHNVPPGGTAGITVRLRRVPRQSIAVSVRTRDGQTKAGSVTFGHTAPRFAGIGFSPALNAITLYPRMPGRAGARPQRIRLDGEDVTARARILTDPALDTSVVVLQADKPLTRGAFHCFEAEYDGSEKAIAGVRCWSDETVYGMWGYINKGKTPQERVDYYLEDLHAHNVNALMYSYGHEIREFMETEAGRKHARRTGMRLMLTAPGKLPDPLYHFLMDEPDAHDFAVKALPPLERLGSLAQDLVRLSRRFREQDPATPHLLNVDNTYKPENWYMYARVADVMCADPYYQEQQKIVWNDRPAWAASFIKPTYVLGVTSICQSACAPRPLHIILNSVRHDDPKSPFRFATAEEKRVEVYYALAAGAKALSYWWYTPYGEFYGCGGDQPDAVKLYREIGLLGAEYRTGGPLIAQSCPTMLPVTAPGRLWVRTLLAGPDTVLAVAVNENIASDRQGTVVRPLEQSGMVVTPPSWLKPADCFEITAGGIRDVTWKAAGGKAEVDLGQTELTRFVVITADRAVRESLATRHRELFAATVAELSRNAK